MTISLVKLHHCAIVAGMACLGVFLTSAQTPGTTGGGWRTTIAYTVPPGANTGVYMKLAPNAVCRLREISPDAVADGADLVSAVGSEQEDDSGETSAAAVNFLRLFSDADGNARFFAQPPAERASIESDFSVICNSSQGLTHYLVRLRAGNRAVPGFPFPPDVDPALRQSNETVLPPLTDPASMTDEQIMLAGYPLRPDPVASPAEYAEWLTAVSKPISVVTAQSVANENIYHGQLVSATWSGDIVNPQQDSFGFAEPYVGVTGQWTVPTTVSGELFRSSAVSEWIGLDGVSASPLIQAGTGQSVLPFGLVPHYLGRPWTVSIYNAWTEVFPLQPEQSLATFPVHPGDKISGGIWISWDDLKPTATGGFAFFQLFNYNTNQSIRTVFEIANLPDFTVKFNFLGHDAEWIVERPSIGPDPNHLTPLDLANYHSQCMNSQGGEYEAVLFQRPTAWVQTGAAGQYDRRLYTELANDNLAMFNSVNGTTYLSGMYPEDNSSMCFEWFNFH